MKKIALVGLTNVGKSTLFNKLCGRHISTSFNDDNTTVDYISHTIDDIILVDTCGLNGVKDFNTLSGEYILNSDLILYVIDGRIPPTNLDIEICKFLKKQGKLLKLICNKTESEKIHENLTKTINYDGIFWVSSEHNLGTDELKVALGFNLDYKPENIPLIALVGRANSGKSSLMNCFVKFERVKVEDKIGTTRDNVICAGETMYNKFNFMDTAGYRKENNALEYITRKRRENSLQYIDGAVLVLDGNLGLTRIDKQIYEEVSKFAKFIIVCINKVDILTEDPMKDFELFNIPRWIPKVQTCAKTGRLGKLREIIDLCYARSSFKIPTSELNDLIHSLSGVLRSKSNISLKIKYMFQKSSNPMVIGYFAREELSDDSIKFLTKQIMKKFDLIGVCIKFELFAKKDNLNFRK